MFGIGQFAEAEQAARAKWQQQHAEWTSFVEQVLPAHNEKVSEQYEANERKRLERLASARAAYKIDCEAREETARAHQQLI
jgi:restriction system protein